MITTISSKENLGTNDVLLGDASFANLNLQIVMVMADISDCNSLCLDEWKLKLRLVYLMCPVFFPTLPF